MGDIKQQQRPSIGRVVHYRPAPHDTECRGNHAEVLPAVIVRVWSDTTVNLKVWTDGPSDCWRPSALHISAVPEQHREDNAYWEWPPYVPPLAASPVGADTPGVV